ncbi:MAG: hypothetical protein RL742_1633 [Bacteroidota bacterium]|jgi:hypothetical protein
MRWLKNKRGLFRKLLLSALALPGLLAAVNLAAQCPESEYADAKELWEVQGQPEFPDGGDAALFRFVSLLPLPGLPPEISPVYDFEVQFVVEKDGKVGRLCALKNPDHPWTIALLNHLALSPTWKPGRLGQEAVPVRYVFPLRLRRE